MAGIAVLKDSCRMYLGPDKEAQSDRALKATDKIGSATSFGEIGAEAEEIDVTTLDSAAKESIPGFDDWGSVTVEQNITKKEDYAKWSEWRRSKAILKIGIIADDNDGQPVIAIKGKCYVKSCKFGGASVGGLLTVSAELKFTGDITEDFTEPVAVLALSEQEELKEIESNEV